LIKLSQIEIIGATSWCKACIKRCGKQDAMICTTCRGYIKTTHTCPDCHVIDSFFGYDVPEKCFCGFEWPDVDLLLESLGSRVEYHISENLQ